MSYSCRYRQKCPRIRRCKPLEASPCGLSPPDCACERPSYLSRPTTPLATANCIPASMGLRLWPFPPASSLRHRRCFSPMETVPAPAFGVAIPHLLPLCRSHRPPLVFSLTRRAGWRIQASSVGSGEFQMELEAVRKMRVSAIKQELDALGVSYRDCFEKEELVNRLALERKRKRVVERPVDVTRLPMRRLKSTAVSPKEYIIIPLTFGSFGTFDFLLDTGSSTTLVSPYVAHSKLGIPPGSGQLSRGLGGMGDGRLDMRRISLPAVTIAGKACKPVEGIIMDLVSTGLPPSVAGIVGLNVLSQFDVEFDFVKEHISLFEVGAVERGHCSKEGLQKLAVAPISFSLPGLQVDMGGGNVQTALIDLGSSLSVTAPSIAKLSGATLEKSALSGVAVGGQQMAFSRAFIDVTMFREQNNTSDKIVFRKVAFAVGDLPAMQAIKCNIILGLNVFSRTRLVLCMSSRTVYLQTFV